MIEQDKPGTDPSGPAVGEKPTGETVIAPKKVDPETLVLRARPTRVIRFRRGAIVGIAAVTSTAMIGLTFVALKPRPFHMVADGHRDDPGSKGPPDALANAPKNYGEAPKLGAPMPGDLGRPFLEHQRSLGVVPTPDPAAQAAEAERQRAVAEQRAAQESGVMIQMGRGERSVAAVVDAAPPLALGEVADGKLPLDPQRDPAGQQRKVDFVAAEEPREVVNPHALAPLPSPYTLSAGSVIAASLITGLRSDLPGLVSAQVTETAYDSATGHLLLVPQGARLIGSYDSVVAFGQKRALVVWQRIIMPDGSSLRLDNVPASDVSGYAGLADKVDLHTWQLLKGVALSTLLGVSSQLALSGQSDLVQAIRMSTQDNVARAGDQITQRNLGVQPTITVRPGTPVRLVVHKDLVFAPAGSH